MNGVAVCVVLVCCTVVIAAMQVGTGIYDATGPAAEVNFMGYAAPGQTAAGIYLRLRSRAYVIIGENGNRIAFVSVDCAMSSQLVTMQVLDRLQAQFGGLYTEQNVCISGTHTHSGPGGFLQYLLFDLTSFGYVRESMDALVDAIYESIVLAHNNVKPASILMNHGNVYNASINRSPTSYLNNPAEERAQYSSNVDENMTLLKFVADDGQELGLLNWFAVHGTSMNNTNKMISGDNKGYASYLAEQWKNGDTSKVWPGHGAFVAAFAQTNEGDVSPNTNGPHCKDTGLPCDLEHSTCNNHTELCIASGPGVDMADSARIIGLRQFEAAQALYESASTVVSGDVNYRHIYANMTNVVVNVNGVNVTTCKPAMGYAFAAGTTDGPGMFNFIQGSNSSNPFWNLVSDTLFITPSPQQVACQFPKPILLDTGEDEAAHWQPQIVDIQVLQVGDLVILAVPAEFTTMSGRRLRNAVSQVLTDNGFPATATVVIAGLSNTYADYVATFEEYQMQRYEAGSTIYGPYTLDAYIQLFSQVAEALATGAQLPPGPSPPNLLPHLIQLLPNVTNDSIPAGKSFGEVVFEPALDYSINETAKVTFWSSNPRSNRTTQGTFLTVEHQDLLSGSWVVVLTDGDWDTQYEWRAHATEKGASWAIITWNIAPTTPAGLYRIRHMGSWKQTDGTLVPFEGLSRSFLVN